MLARLALHAGLWLLGFLVLAALLQRPVFAAVIVLGIQGLIVAVSAVKEKYLREPLVVADLGLFTQAFRHPRLYVPYFGTARAIAVAGAFAAAIAAGFVFEEPRGMNMPLALALFVVALLLLTAGSALGRPSLDPGEDVRRFGVLGAMWLYWLAERRAVVQPRTPFAHIQVNDGAQPHVVVVQSESFFDVRRLNASMLSHWLANFDALTTQAEHGRLSVPVWGAYTMRTEFAFLSAIPPAELGVHRFNPYRRFARRGVPTIASALRHAGYRTLCMHPYPSSFFARDRVYPVLGFDAFMDSADFKGASTEGPYVADSAVALRILEVLRDAREPTFIFAITMENHGPLHLEHGDELSVYLRHLRNADEMFGAVAEGLRRIGDGVLCVYGDHVPGMPSVYAKHAFDDSRTDYLLWRASSPRALRADLAVEQLGLRVLERAGLAAAPA
jgi:hypothetical protein